MNSHPHHQPLPSRSGRNSGSSGPGLSPSSPSLAPKLWNLRIPLYITHPDRPDVLPYIVSVPRFSYLAQLLPKLCLYFQAPCSSFRFEGIELRNFFAGLLSDLYRPKLPWRLHVVDLGGWDIKDTFLNSVKEADFIRNGHARLIMGMGVDDTKGLWEGVCDNRYESFAIINNKLLYPPIPIRHIPLRLYIPMSRLGQTVKESTGSYRVLQTLVSLTQEADRVNDATTSATSRFPALSGLQGPRTLGKALKSIVPELFPSSRDPVLANVIMHGTALPLNASLEELMREAAYPDGWVNLVVDLF